MTIQTLLQQAQYKFSQGPDNDRFAADFWQALNDSQNEIAVVRNWGFLRTTTTLTASADTRTIALPSDFCSPYRIRGAITITTSGYSGDVIELLTVDEWYQDHFEDGSDTGEPDYAYIMGTSLYLSAIPDAAYTMNFPYYKLPATLEDTSDTIGIPTKYHELLKKMLYRRLQDDGYSPIAEMQVSDEDIERLMNRAARDDASEFGSWTMNLNSNTYNRKTT